MNSGMGQDEWDGEGRVGWDRERGMVKGYGVGG